VKDVEALAAGCKGSVDAFRKSIFLLFGLDLVELKNPPKTVLADEKRAQADDLKARLQEVEELQAEMGALDDYQILGVRSDSDENEVKKSYFKMARKFHPDLFGRSLGPAQKDLVEGVFDGITKAYRNLLAKLGKSEAAPKSAAPPPASNQGRSKGAEIHFRQAKTLYHNGRYEEAISLLEEAVRIKDDKGDYFLLLALAQSRIPALRRKAERNFLQAIELEPWNPEALIGLGMLYKKEGLVARAKKQFERAVEADPEHAGARQELRSIQSKSTSQKGLKGILTKDLFGSKKK
jgi:tetratricopeptide (TPR) repeat protein